MLAKVAALPITSWEYGTTPGVRHMGPMGQDFRAAFGLGYDETSIATIDADGVALAAIKGLYELVQEKDAKLTAQASEIATLQLRLARVEAKTDDATENAVLRRELAALRSAIVEIQRARADVSREIAFGR
jgi:hypothetical protein